MEEGQTVEIQETREPLREQGSVRALLELLEQQGMEQEKGDVTPYGRLYRFHGNAAGNRPKGIGRGEEATGCDAGKQGQTLCGEHNPEGGTSGANTSFSGGRI